MKLSKQELKQIIKEELKKVMSENDGEKAELGKELRTLRHSRDYMTADYDEFLRIIKQDKGYAETEDELHDAYMAARGFVPKLP